MAHARQQIREAIVTAVTGLTTTGANVFDSRVYPYDDTSLPCVAVYARQEGPSDEYEGRKSERDLLIVVEARTKKTASMEDEIDTICAEVEAVLGADRTLGGVLLNLEIEETSIDLTDDADQPTGLAEMTWRASYRVDPSDAETIL